MGQNNVLSGTQFSPVCSGTNVRNAGLLQSGHLSLKAQALKVSSIRYKVQLQSTIDFDRLYSAGLDTAPVPGALKWQEGTSRRQPCVQTALDNVKVQVFTLEKDVANLLLNKGFS